MKPKDRNWIVSGDLHPRLNLLVPLFGVIAVSVSMAALPLANASDHLTRVVSLNLCTDQLVLQLVNRERIASITYLATDPAISHFADRARGLHINHGRAEEILPLEPDLILAGQYTTRPTTALLRRLGYRVMVFQPADSFDAIRQNIRRAAAALGEKAKGEEVVRQLDAAINLVDPPPNPPTAVILRPKGVTIGKGSLVDDVIRAAGLRNLSAALGIGGQGLLSLETLVEAKPDLVIMDRSDPDSPSLAHQMLRHPALMATIRSLGHVTVQVDLPTHFWNCGGSYTGDAVAILSKARRAFLERRKGR